jgi:hypothetical protein
VSIKIPQRRFAKMHNLAKKIYKGLVRMGEGMCEFMSPPKEIEYFNEYKAMFF